MVLEELQKLGLPNLDEVIASIRMISGDLNLAQLRELYCAADYYVSPYRGEGFNLPVIEAIACGTTPIVTQGGATDDFCSPGNAIFIPAQLHRNAQVGAGNTATFLEPDENALLEILEHCIQHHPAPQRTKTIAAALIGGHFAWSCAAQTIAAALFGRTFATVSALTPTTINTPTEEVSDIYTYLKKSALPTPRHLLQIGASYGQEIPYFVHNGIQSIVLVEPLDEPVTFLKENYGRFANIKIIQALCSDTEAEACEFYVASNAGQSSSLLRPKNHLSEFSWVKFSNTLTIASTTVDKLISEARRTNPLGFPPTIDTLYLDTQGSELKVLKGAQKLLKEVEYVYTEVTRNEMYQSAPTLKELMEFLDGFNFSLNNVGFNEHHHANALFVKNSLVEPTVARE
jgi:FkbM family methyltransferase